MRFYGTFTALALVLFCSMGRATTYTVPVPYPTIQLAVAACTYVYPGDDVLVSPGTYPETVDVNGKNVFIHSTGANVDGFIWHNPNSLQNCGGGVSGFTIAYGITATDLNEDFTLSSSSTTSALSFTANFGTLPGLVEIQTSAFDLNGQSLSITVYSLPTSNAAARVEDCTFHDARLAMASDASAIVRRCTMNDASMDLRGDFVEASDNRVVTVGPGIEVVDTNSGCDIARNFVQGASVGISYRGDFLGTRHIFDNTLNDCDVGITSPHADYGIIERNVICECGNGMILESSNGSAALVNNTVATCGGDGIRFLDLEITDRIERNLVVQNGVGIRINGNPDPSHYICNDVWNNPGGNWLGIVDPVGTNDNISVDPLFCAIDACDLSLHSNSPCLAQSSPCGLLIGALGEGDCPPPVPTEETTWGSIKERFHK